MSAKPSNPKDIIGSGKLPMELVPDIPEDALAFLEGALKYGRFNWRVAGVRASIYAASMQRHMKKWWNGQDADSKTRVKHLLSIRACCAILLDAERVGKLTDDRPPRADIDAAIEEAEEVAKHLRELFKDCTPHQWTINDEVGEDSQTTVEGFAAPPKEMPAEEGISRATGLRWPNAQALNPGEKLKSPLGELFEAGVVFLDMIPKNYSELNIVVGCLCGWIGSVDELTIDFANQDRRHCPVCDAVFKKF